MREFWASHWKRILVWSLAIVLVLGAAGQYTMWQRYGVFAWWDDKPRFLKVRDRGYSGHGLQKAPEPHYCVLGTMFPFSYPIAAASPKGPDGRDCETTEAPVTVYLKWKDEPWTVYGRLGGP
ncbi:hypothetical protein [Mycobacteroides chelonae]|uniref:hypothetical protein n=1 Tax=Mycobacteroides chelonae TaxID=1774 RepID=UPI0018B05EAF|nr:hypothetical protein [Mycobacteroides chelonae]MBF9328440.1 hypothetical protein [Mycobacteroides chelonae]MBF9422618.1 hypothetical protein [Mycobacteroides chelonae]